MTCGEDMHGLKKITNRRPKMDKTKYAEKNMALPK
jgi:hypothetical protein